MPGASRSLSVNARIRLGGSSRGGKTHSEDEQDIAEILALVLRGEGYIVDTAGTLAQARHGLTR